jgi:exopolyphosphatase/guanosine-5'-triphosphate,3'-diphosphate pyrophosphatase
MIRASIDLGTNTCLLLMREGDRVVGDYSTIVRLGQKVDEQRALHPDAMERTLACLREYAKSLKAAGGSPDQAKCVATSQARDARNGADFFARVRTETGFQFQVITGEEEARLTFLGALLPGMKPETSAVIDIGGGSTELISATGGQSLDLGSVRFSERFLKSDPVTDAEFWACQAEADRMLETFQPWRSANARETELVAVAGTATALAAWHLGLPRFDARAIDGLVLTRGDVHRMVEELKWRSIEERRQLPSMEPMRADVILAGALILWRAMEILKFPEARISTRGLRYGLWLES